MPLLHVSFYKFYVFVYSKIFRYNLFFKFKSISFLNFECLIFFWLYFYYFYHVSTVMKLIYRSTIFSIVLLFRTYVPSRVSPIPRHPPSVTIRKRYPTPLITSAPHTTFLFSNSNFTLSIHELMTLGAVE